MIVTICRPISRAFPEEFFSEAEKSACGNWALLPPPTN
jgi:hypothetical protein